MSRLVTTGIFGFESRVLATLASISSTLAWEKFLRRCPCLINYRPRFFTELALSIEPKAYGPFEMIFQQNSPGRDIYFINKGQVEVLTKNQIQELLVFHVDLTLVKWHFYHRPNVELRLFEQLQKLTVWLLLKKHTITLYKDYPEFQNHIEETANSRIGSNQFHDIWQTDSNTGSSRYLSYWRTTMTKSSSEKLLSVRGSGYPTGQATRFSPVSCRKRPIQHLNMSLPTSLKNTKV